MGSEPNRFSYMLLPDETFPDASVETTQLTGVGWGEEIH